MIPILSPVVFFGLNTLKSTTKSLAVDLSRLNTLGATGTKIVFFFNLLRVRKAPPPPPSFFLYGNPPGLVCLSKLHFLLGCWLVLKMLCCSNLHCVTLFCIYKRDNINSLHWPFSLWTYGYTKYCLKSYHNKFDIFFTKIILLLLSVGVSIFTRLPCSVDCRRISDYSLSPAARHTQFLRQTSYIDVGDAAVASHVL